MNSSNVLILSTDALQFTRSTPPCPPFKSLSLPACCLSKTLNIVVCFGNEEM